MEEDMAIIDSILREEAEFNGERVEDADSGWKTVKVKPSRRNSRAFITPEFIRANGASVVTVDASSGVFRSLEKEAEERRRRVVEAQRAALEIAASVGVGAGTYRSKEADVQEEEKEDQVIAGGGVAVTVADNAGDRKGKKKNTPKVTVSEAAAKIDADHLAAFLIDASNYYEFQEDIQLTRFANYFSRAFASVSSAQFPWQKMLKESSVAKMIDIPLAHLPEAVYKVSVDWIDQRSLTPVGSFILWLWDSILPDHANSQGTVKSSRKVVQEGPSKSLVAIFMLLAITLRRKPDVLISLLPILKGSPKYFEQRMLPLNVWLICQASQGDLTVGFYMWVRVLLLPMLSGKSTPQTRDLILQVAERILSSPKARQLLLNQTVIKGERLVPPSALEVLMRLTFPSSETRIKATERFVAIYPTLKNIALASFQSKKAVKQVSEQAFSIALDAAAVPNLSEEATDLAIWSLIANPACYKQWDKLYLDNIEASATILRKLAVDWKEISAKLCTDTLRKTLEHLMQKNRAALASKDHTPERSSLQEADKQCRAVLARISPGHHWLKIVMIVSVLLGVCSVLLATVSKLSADYPSLTPGI